MSYAYDPIYDEWNHDEPECLLVDTCPHGVPDDRPCVDCDEDDARVTNEVMETIAVCKTMFKFGAENEPEICTRCAGTGLTTDYETCSYCKDGAR